MEFHGDRCTVEADGTVVGYAVHMAGPTGDVGATCVGWYSQYHKPLSHGK
jgi:hypothetical protein